MKPGQANTGHMILSLPGVRTLGLHQPLHALWDEKMLGPIKTNQNGTPMLGMQAVQKADQLVTAKRPAVK